MGNFARQIILLTKKNLRIRCSHWCLSVCELLIPLVITAAIGIVVSYNDKRWHHRLVEMSPSSFGNNNDSVESKFACVEYEQYAFFQKYWCEVQENFVNSRKNMEAVEGLNIHYIFGDNVKDQYGLADEVMSHVLNAGSRNESLGNKLTTNWTKSVKTEKELEICVLQKHKECSGLSAAVIITHIEDAVKTEKKFEIEYKVRVVDAYHDFHIDKLFAPYSNLDSFEAHGTLVSSGVPYFHSQEKLGFIFLQAFLDRGIVDYIKTKYRNETTDEITLSLVKMPLVMPNFNVIERTYRFISLLYCLLASLSIFNLMRVNSEKHCGFRELLRMHGVTTTTQWMGWLFSNLFVYSIWTLLLALFFNIPFAGGKNVLLIYEINCIVHWILLLIFMMSITTFSFMISVFFERMWTAASIGLVSWIMLTVFMMATSAALTSLSKWSAIGLMLIPTVAFDFCFQLLLNGGGTVQNLATEVIENVHLTPLHCLFMLLLDSCIFMTLTLYLDNVLPAKYGVSKHPLYFLRDFRRFLEKVTKVSGAEQRVNNEGKNEESVEMTSEFLRESEQHAFQPDPEHVEAAVVIQNLKKQFRKNQKRAVDGLNVKMFTGEIYALLGFNGAGKTTTIDILTEGRHLSIFIMVKSYPRNAQSAKSPILREKHLITLLYLGLTSPTDGVGRIFDFDIATDMDEIRKHIGLCPQHNLLFDEMIVLEQVAFFAELKGLLQPRKKARELLTWLGLSEKLFLKPKELSGGQIRIVHLAIALIGHAKLAFLDEPTSGLDPETRRGVWDILLKLRGKMTLILTTHDMEEANVLGDRIGIMADGKMMCSGTPSFLKKHYGVGYNLNISKKSSQCDPEKVWGLTKDYVANAKLNPVSGQSSAESLDSISISLPTADLDLSKMADMMDALRTKKDELEIENIGLSLSTMDEVFLKVGEAVQAVNANSETTRDPSGNTLSSSRYSGSRLHWYRFTSLIVKRMLYFCSAPLTLVFLILLFSVFLWLSLTALSFAANINPDTSPRVVSASSLSFYQNPVILLHESGTTIPETSTSNFDYGLSYKNLIHKYTKTATSPININEFPETTTFQELMTSLKNDSINDVHNYRKTMLVGASFNMTKGFRNMAGFYSPYAFHSAPLSLNLISQTLIKKMYGVDATIGVVNHPFKQARKYDYIHPAIIMHQSYDSFYYFIKCGGVILLIVITSLLTGTAALLPTEERLNKGKQLQLMTGTTPFIYWTSMFAWDFLYFSMVNLLITLVYILADYCSGNWIFTNNGAGALILLILECHSFAALWLCYLISRAPCIKTASDSFLIVNKLAVIIGVLWNVIRHILIVTYHNYGNYFSQCVYYFVETYGYVAAIVPMHSLFSSMFKLATMSMHNSVCHWFPEDILHLTCAKSKGVENEQSFFDYIRFIERCCANCEENCFETRSYMSMESIEIFNGYKTHAMIFDILLLILSGFINVAILFLLEYCFDVAKPKQQSHHGIPETEHLSTNRPHDEDAVNETLRVDYITGDNVLETADHALIVQNLHLGFDKVKAVDGISFGVIHGECFGLLGVNGAGKTSTFRIITGDISPSQGSMWFSGGLNCYRHRSSYLASLGYCPQFDAIIGSLTGLQMVKLYGALRGIPSDKLKEDATVWLDKFGLLGSANKKCANYSGGMKRRLSAAMALIGNQSLLLLDEPTIGVDPAFRRQFWNVIREIRESGQTVLLTSHTTDECEALCTRLGIMVDGQFKCLGSIQHLKRKFGYGYILTVKLKRVPDEDEQENEEKVKLLQDEITAEFGLCCLQTKQKTLIQYQILNKFLWYSDVFRAMERIRNLSDFIQIIEEYSVTETSLEDVFISFAKRKEW